MGASCKAVAVGKGCLEHHHLFHHSYDRFHVACAFIEVGALIDYARKQNPAGSKRTKMLLLVNAGLDTTANTL